MFLRTVLLVAALFFSANLYAQNNNANPPTPAQNEVGGKTYTNNLFAGVFAFLSFVGVLVVICMPVRKN